MKHVLFVTGIFMMTSYADRPNRMMELKVMMKGASAYQILERAFEEASEPLNMGDVSAAATQKCVYAVPNEYEVKSTAVLVVHSTKVTEPGHPALPERGPLLPAEPADPGASVTKYFPFTYFTGTDQITFDKYFDIFDVKMDNNLITVTADEAPGFELSHPHIEVAFKKNQNLLVFAVHGTAKEKVAPLDLHGYCYKSAAPPKKKK